MAKIKSSLVISVVLIVLSLSLAGGVFYLLQKQIATNKTLQEELDDVQTKYRIAETELQRFKKKISEFEVKLQESQTQIDTLTRDLQQERTAREEALSQAEQLRINLEQQKELKSDLEKKLIQAQKDIEKTQAQLKELGAKKAELETEIKDLEAQSQRVELGKIVVGAETLMPAPESVKSPRTKGKILVINKDYNFVVIDLGSQDGVEIGNLFSVYHNDVYLGEVKVEKVHDSMAAAGFVSAQVKDKVNEGDKVVPKTK